MRKVLLLLLLALCLLPAAALADTELTVTPREMGFDYEITTDDTWIRLQWKGPAENGIKTLHSPEGHYAGTIDLPCSAEGGKFTVTVQNLKVATVAKQKVTVPQKEGYEAPKGNANARVKNLVLTETTEGFKYSFVAEGTDYMMLRYHSKQEDAYFPVYPVNEEGLYEGEVIAPLTYSRTQFTVKICNHRGKTMKEATVRKAYKAPDPVEQKPGRLSGVVVCIDPGHQENAEPFSEPLGPGLKGVEWNSGGMAQGRTTLRRESIVNMETAVILRDLLLQEGATVVLTRDAQDIFHTNIERCEIAEKAGAHIMLRLHCNSNKSTKQTGVGVYGPVGSDYAKAVADKDEYYAMGMALLTEMKNAVGYEHKDTTGMVHLNNNYVGNNWAKMVCFLVEMGYMTNPGEDIKLATPEYQTIVSQGMVEGVYQIALMRGWVTE